MPRIRLIKPELFTDERVVSLSIEARYLFVGLLPFADDMGRGRFSPLQIRNLIFK